MYDWHIVTEFIDFIFDDILAFGIAVTAVMVAIKIHKWVQRAI